jgi:hypothetical protein
VSKAQSTPEEIINKFFAIYKQGNSEKAVDYLFANTPFAKDIEEGVDNAKRQLKKQYEQIGTYYGADLLSTKTAGPNVKMYTYLVRHSKQPLTFNIMFYKPNDKWQMQSFKFANNTSDELEEASKAYRMKENYDR